MRLLLIPAITGLVLSLQATAEVPHPKPAETVANAAKDAPPAHTHEIAVAAARPAHLATTSSILVKATAPPLSPTSHQITSDLIETAAGAFEDPSRYFQLLPGVVSDSDQRNDFLVRGGNPGENLFVVDNIDVHSINHLALADTTGGFVSMIDNAAIQSMTLHSAGHDARFDDRLSSVVEISTIPEIDGTHSGHHLPVRHMTEVGIAGVGGMDSRPIGENGSLFISGRQSVFHLFTNDIGLNGVPRYTNNLIRGDYTLANGDKLWGLSLTGIDSIAIRPAQLDPQETNPFNIDYNGWRNTTGFNWQHLFSARAFSVFTLSNSEQAQTVTTSQQYSFQTGSFGTGLDSAFPVYNEQTHDGDSTLKTQFTLQANPRLLLSGGGTENLKRIHYDITQPDGIPNPYTATSSIASATSIRQQFTLNDDAGYAQAVLTLPASLRLTLATRVHHWAGNDLVSSHTALTPKASLSIPLGLQRILSVGIADYTQLPPFLYLLAFPQSGNLAPIRARHLTTALTLIDLPRLRLTLAAYRKTYRDYPVSTEFPQLSVANIADTFGQAFLLFPMVSKGLGKAAGAELSLDLRPTSRLNLTGNLAYARSWYSGLDGVLRKGSFDLPLVANVAGVLQAGKGVVVSARFSGTSGRPYTPDNLPLSYQQNRDVYDLTRINALRSIPYARIDLRVEKRTTFRSGTLLWHAGLDNALNRRNFYSYQWQPWVGGVAQQSQMPRFPDGGVKYLF